MRTDFKKDTVIAETLAEALLMMDIAQSELTDCYFVELEPYLLEDEKRKELCGAV